MIQTELYIREITRFLKTVTLKNIYFDEQMQNEWVKDQWRDSLPTNLRPYYRHLAGDYILKDLSEWVAAYRAWDPSTKKTDKEIEAIGRNIYGLTTTTKLWDSHGNPVELPNTAIYNHFDRLVVVWSIDTKEVIPFTKTVLTSKQHHKTASLYRIPNRYFYNICEQYPDQVDLIKAIVYPISSVVEAEQAGNFSILSCDLSLLEINEQASLYTCMLETLAVIRRRWDVAEFTYEDLYALSIQGKIWSILLTALFKQRILNIRTSSACKYHVWEYLKSKGLKDYRDVLSTKQAIFLYRNFPFILRNRGTDRNLILLAHKLLSEWNIVLNGKNLLQQTERGSDKTVNTAKVIPVIDSVEIAKVVMNDLREIDRNEDKYILKQMKYADELEVFNNLSNDLQELNIGTIESLDEIYDKQKQAGLEYQIEELFEISKNKQTPLFERTAHTYLPTKLLEITKSTESTLLQQLYTRYVTEALFYHLSKGNLDYIISFTPEGALYPVNLTVAQAIAMVIYCSLKETNTYVEGSYPPTLAKLERIFSSEYIEVPETYNWCNLTQKTSDALRIIPMEIEASISSKDLIYKGVFRLMNPNDEYTSWYWIDEQGTMLTYVDMVSKKYWTLQGDGFEMEYESTVPYSNWKKWEPIWTGTSDMKYTSLFNVTEYDYFIDRCMPVADKFETLDEVMEYIHSQALGYLQIYLELHGSDWSRQHAAVHTVVSKRTITDTVSYSLFTSIRGEPITYDEFINKSPDLNNLVSKIEGGAESSRSTSYAILGNNILKTLFASIDTKYLQDNAGVSANRFKKLKELFVSLCSYNIAFLEGNVGSEDVTMTLPGFITQDIAHMVHGITTFEYVDATVSGGSFAHHEFIKFEPPCIHASVGKEVMNTPIPIAEDEIVTGDYVRIEGDTPHIVLRALDVSDNNSKGAAIPFGCHICDAVHAWDIAGDEEIEVKQRSI